MRFLKFGLVSIALLVLLSCPLWAARAAVGPDQDVSAGTVVTLDASASQPTNGGDLSFSWIQTKGPVVALSNPASATPSFTAPPASQKREELRFQVTVTESGQPGRGKGNQRQDTATVSIFVLGGAVGGTAPIANAGPDQSVAAGAAVRLDGTSSSDPNGGTLSFSWIQMGGPAVLLSGADSASPTFNAPNTAVPVNLTFQLRVTNPAGASAIANVTVAVSPQGVNRPPVADAGPNQTVAPGDRVRLDGSASSNPSGEALTYRWQQVSGTVVTLAGTNTPVATFTAPSSTGAVQLLFRLTVSDASGASSGVVTILISSTAEPIPSPAPAPPAKPAVSITSFSAFPNPYDPHTGPAGLEYDLGTDCSVKIRIYDLFGGLVREMDLSGQAGSNRSSWDGRNGKGEMVGNGGYVLHLEASADGKTVTATDRLAVVK